MGRITNIPAVQRVLDRSLSWIEDCLSALRQWHYERDPSNTEGAYLDKFVTRDEARTLGLVRLQDGGTLTRNAALLDALNVHTRASGVTWIELTDGTTIQTNAELGNNFSVTLGGNRTLGEPANLRDGFVYRWRVVQDGTGSRTLAFNAIFDFMGGLTFIQSAANEITYVIGVFRGARNKVEVTFVGRNSTTLRVTSSGEIAAVNDPLGTLEFYSKDVSANSTGVFGRIGTYNEFSGAWDGTLARVDTYMGFATTTDGALVEKMRITSDGRLRITSGVEIAAVNDAIGVLDFHSSDASANSNGVFGRIGVHNEFAGAWDGTASRVDTYMAFSTAKDGTMAERVRIDDSGDVHTYGQIRAGGWNAGSTVGTIEGLAAELGVSAGEVYLLSYNRGGSVYGAMNLQGTALKLFDSAGATRLQMIPTTFDIVTRLTATAPALGTNLDMAFNLTSATNLRISVRGSDGTTRTANITLA